jgi:hypothetical protein
VELNLRYLYEFGHGLCRELMLPVLIRRSYKVDPGQRRWAFKND